MSSLVRAILLLALHIAPALAAELPPTRAEALALVERLGGKVEFDPGSAGAVSMLDLSRTPVTDAQLGLLALFPEIQSVDVRLTAITDEGVARLRPLRGLRTLNLFRTAVTDAGLAHLAGLSSLETLLIGGTRVTDEGMGALLPLRGLVKVSLFDTQVGDTGALRLASLPRLRVLLLDRSRVTESGRAHILQARPGISFAESDN